jgi:quercetin dioxygenase-like cupin family protein
MYSPAIWKHIALVGAVLMSACDRTAPTAVATGSEAAAGSTAHALPPNAASLALLQATEPFTVRAPVDPYKIHQLPEFMINSNVRADLVFQRLVLPPGSVPWHTHPGPSFVIVEQGQVMVSVFHPKTGCVHSPVLGPGDTFYRVADEVHRPTVVSADNAVLYVVRFNIPIGAAITDPVGDPGC